MPGAFAPRKEAMAPPAAFGPERNHSLKLSANPFSNSTGAKASSFEPLATLTGRSVKKSFRLPKKLCWIAFFLYSDPREKSPGGRFTDAGFGAFGSGFGVSFSIVISRFLTVKYATQLDTNPAE